MTFDKNTSKIAITIPWFKLLKRHSELFEGFTNEPYIVAIAVDATNPNKPGICMNFASLPHVKAGDKIDMLGDGHLVYGPENPGEWVVLSILIMESDKDIRNLGGQIEDWITSQAVELGLSAIILANPGAGGVLAIVKELTRFVAGKLVTNRDDELFRISGIFLQNLAVPYHIDEEFISRNQYIELAIKVIPLDEEAGMSEGIKRIVLDKE